MTEAHINIGSNIGDPRRLFPYLLNLLKGRFEQDFRVSQPIVTRPWGFESDHDFVNIGCSFRISEDDCPPIKLLDILQAFEKKIDPSPHRNPDGSYRDRVIDVDLIYVGRQVIDTPRLTLPHPRMDRRDFVLIPLDSLSPEWRHPVTGLTPSQMLERLRNEVG